MELPNEQHRNKKRNYFDLNCDSSSDDEVLAMNFPEPPQKKLNFSQTSVPSGSTTPNTDASKQNSKSYYVTCYLMHLAQ